MAKSATRKPKRTAAARVLLFHEDLAKGAEVAAQLEREGFEVARAANFLEAVPHLSPGGASLILVYLPLTDFVRNTFLAEARQEAPKLPIVALAAEVTDELKAVLARFGLQAVLPASAKWSEVVRTLREALGAAS